MFNDQKKSDPKQPKSQAPALQYLYFATASKEEKVMN